MKNLKKQYKDLKEKVLSELVEKIKKSNYISKHTGDKALQVNVFDYTELTIVNDRLTLLDNNGQHYSLWADCNLEDLIDILNKDSVESM